jgi:hypothetical protein
MSGVRGFFNLDGTVLTDRKPEGVSAKGLAPPLDARIALALHHR